MECADSLEFRLELQPKNTFIRECCRPVRGSSPLAVAPSVFVQAKTKLVITVKFPLLARNIVFLVHSKHRLSLSPSFSLFLASIRFHGVYSAQTPLVASTNVAQDFLGLYKRLSVTGDRLHL